jgi:hypothetical protein
MDSLQARRIAGTEGAGFPFWSPDGRFAAFFVDDTIKKVAVDGSTPQVVCKTLQPRRGTWNSKGDILFSVGEKNGIFRVADSGGVAQEITKPDPSRGESAHSWPQFLPDDEHFLYLSISKGKFTAMAASLDSKVLNSYELRLFRRRWIGFLKRARIRTQRLEQRSLALCEEILRL